MLQSCLLLAVQSHSYEDGGTHSQSVTVGDGYSSCFSMAFESADHLKILFVRAFVFKQFDPLFLLPICSKVFCVVFENLLDCSGTARSEHLLFCSS